jgi:deoxyribodipyrimidine photo-lyase
MRSPLPIGDDARRFAAAAVSDAVTRTARRYRVDGELSETSDWGSLLIDWAGRQQVRTIVTPYVPVGPVCDLLDDAKAALERDGIRLLRPRRPYDSAAWPHARRGYFKMKEKIPAILEQLGIRAGNHETAQSA